MDRTGYIYFSVFFLLLLIAKTWLREGLPGTRVQACRQHACLEQLGAALLLASAMAIPAWVSGCPALFLLPPLAPPHSPSTLQAWPCRHPPLC